jgi:putative spermidine/putrescine transport system ATP-binding protein
MTLTSGSDGLVTTNGYGIELRGTARGALRQGPVTVAVRPEDFVVGEPPADETNRIEVGVEVVEYHGRELAVQARLPEGQALLLRTPTRVSRGETIPVWVPRDRVLVFGTAQDSTTDSTSAEASTAPVPRAGTPRGDEAEREHEVTSS